MKLPSKQRERALRILAAVVVWLGVAMGMLAVITAVAWLLQAACVVVLGKILWYVGLIWAAALVLGAYIDCHRKE